MFDDVKVQEQYDVWMATDPIENDVLSEKELRNRIISELTTVSQMPVDEYTLYQKYLEIHNNFPTKQTQTLFGEEKDFENDIHRQLIYECKKNIWFPESPEDFEKLDVEMIYTDMVPVVIWQVVNNHLKKNQSVPSVFLFILNDVIFQTLITITP